MKRRTKKILLNVATGVAIVTTIAVITLPAAQAAPARVTGNVNVRSGPGTSYHVISTISRGTSVDVGRCQASYCQVQFGRSQGWVSSSYLVASNNNGPGQNHGPGPGGNRPPQQPGLGIGINIGPNGPSISFNGGNPPPQQRPPVQQATNSEVCFYDRAGYQGASACLEQGQSVSDLGSLAQRVSSIDNPDGLAVQVCGDPSFSDCRTYTSSASSLGSFDNYIVSARVR